VILVDSRWRKALVTVVAIGAFVWLYQATMLDSRDAARRKLITEAEPNPAPAPGSQLVFTATAYCKGQVTSTGVAPRRGVIAADLALLPMGSVVEIDSRDAHVDGIYTVLDTGPDIQGRRIDLYMWSCNDALQFGRQTVSLTVVRLGWNPRATTRSFMERLFNPTEVEAEPEATSVPSIPSSEERTRGSR
jgi:3D (Asp-Asp-Asp) domain-containing protein